MKQALADALQQRGYTTLTPVQEAVSRPELVGVDLLVSAQTGSGKTLGFGLAIAPTLLGEDESFGRADTPLALIIAPTRELALQVKRELGWLYEKAGAVMASCVGGMDMRTERRTLERGAHVVVATPGRLRDHITRGSIDLSGIRAIVLDEADEMLDLGFREDLEFILGEAPDERQTLLFSATVPRSIAELAKSYQKNAERIVTKSETTQHADIDYRAMSVSDRDGENAVINTLRFYEAPNAIVFCNTREMVNRLTTRLSNRGFQVVALSGELSQAERSHALQAMRDGRARVCVATDVAARGIDLPNLDLVIHAELPNSFETLLHRSGRTGRAGRKGVSAMVVTYKNRRKANRILSMAQLTAEWGDAPSAEDVLARDEERMLADPIWTETGDADPETVTRLAEKFTPEQLARAYLTLYRAQHTAPEELSAATDERPAKRAEFGPSVWFQLSVGRTQRAEPRRLLPMLCKAGDITKNEIGAIRIQDDHTVFEIREPNAEAFLAAIGPERVLEDGIKLERLDSAPTLAPMTRTPYEDRPRKPHRGADKPHYAKGGKDGEKRFDRPRDDAGSKPAGGRPKAKFDPDRADKPYKKDKPFKKDGDKPASPYKKDKPFKKDGAAKSDSPYRKDKESYSKKGPKPPAGKPTSKKNKARASTGKPVSAMDTSKRMDNRGRRKP
ncbi:MULTISPECIES: DEAD/DEAH box helicase [unclassified Meridianimarinicoccus]|uniref:DEAD/DEAH box helicase n=1 Tax=unclassified Meridianimarinicoccus TaxID=2923344 RepID=UPI00186752A3|nr:DEAD/DEAH box helicase [Fluviibacterium sp. MJW13]